MRDFNLDNAIKHLSDAVKIETVSNIDYEKVEWYKFDDFLAFWKKNIQMSIRSAKEKS